MATFLAVVGICVGVPASPAAAATNQLTLQVVDTAGNPIADFEYLINVDNTGTTAQRSPADGCTPSSPGYPDSCDWMSIAGVSSSSPIATQGTAADFAGGVTLTLPDGRYLVSVRAPGYKLDGEHFAMPLAGVAPGVVTVVMQPHPLPTATIQAAVFEDVSIVNGAPDAPVEHGLAGFQAHLFDYGGQITTDMFGQPLGTEYDAAGNPIPGTGGQVYSRCYVVSGGVDVGTVVPIDADGRCPNDSTGLIMEDGNPAPAGSFIEGKIKIPNMGTNRFALTVVAPDGSNWLQTTTLEGNSEWDTWVMEGSTGLDTEFVVAGEPFPTPLFGFVPPMGPLPAGPAGRVQGVIMEGLVHSPPKGGTGLPGTIWGGTQGMALGDPITDAWVALTTLTAGDTAIYVGPADPVTGAFDIANVPDGTYVLTWWDEAQNYILDLIQVHVIDGETVDLGILPLTGWWTPIEGYVFEDLNRNGQRDANEPGVPDFPLTMRKRENSLMDRGAAAVTTDANGYYIMENTYPMTQWLVLEAYHDLFYTTGITYQADNQTTETTVLSGAVDTNVLPIIGLRGRMDWGVHRYDPTGANGIDPRHGGIAGTVTYDTTRNEFDARYAAAEDWQPGISGLTVELHDTVACGTNVGVPCDDSGRYELAPDGAYAKGPLLNTAVTEHWEPPTGCVARDVDGNPLIHGVDENVLPLDPDARCLEGPIMGVQFSADATVDGNYGFGDECLAGTLDVTGPDPVCRDAGGVDIGFTTLRGAHDYLVSIVVPDDPIQGRPLYKLTREEDINVNEGDDFVPAIPPPACAGSLHTVDVAGVGTDAYPAVVGDGGVTNNLPVGVTVPASTPTVNPTFSAAGGTPLEGAAKPLCDTKLVTVSNGRSVAPTFNYFTDVPLPGRAWGLIVDDLSFSGDPQSLLYGEKTGVPFAPVGIYDYTDRHIHTIESDFNGMFDVLLPSTNRIDCPTPSGVCANMYRFVGNDPGTPGNLNLNYNPRFRTIAADFEFYPGLIVPADLAPTQVGVVVQLPGGQFEDVACTLEPTTPQLYAVSQPYAETDGTGAFTISGAGFGAAAGEVTLNGTPLPVGTWTDTLLDVTVPAGTSGGPQRLEITAANGESTVNDLTFHAFGLVTNAFPTTPLVDDFNRNGALGGSWQPPAGYLLAGALPDRYVEVGLGAGLMRNTSGPYGPNQEAWYTVDYPGVGVANGLLLKQDGAGNNTASWSYIEVTYLEGTGTVEVRTKEGNAAPVVQGTITGVDVAAGDQFGAKALDTGDVIVFVNGEEVGRVTITGALVAAGGGIGVSYAGTTLTNVARFDDFGGGDVADYHPNVYEVGPGRDFIPVNQLPAAADHSIQEAIDAAAASPGDDLVVVYPGVASTDRINPRGAYHENLVITQPVKLQGVGPGSPDGSVPGSIIDAAGFAGDNPVFDDWWTLVSGLDWVGNQTVFDGAGITFLAETETIFPADPSVLAATTIDGFDLRGGNQHGFPGNINRIGGFPTGHPGGLVTQGGAIFANGYTPALEITNNVIQNNGGAYGAIRIGNPDLPEPETDNHNDGVVIDSNRIIANAGTNLAGAIGLFAGSDGYEVANNDICGNFSAEYGGGISVYGFSPGGSIHHNRIYFNASFDEGAGVMIAGQLPATPGDLSPGSGPVDIHHNLIQANLSNDDGGGIRFLMAGNYPMNVVNNMIVNNISTHEGGGISLNDAPDVRIVNNTIMKNLTTATAVTSTGAPAPAGLSTARNSDQLQATLPVGSPLFSNPELLNNIFWDNRAGSRFGGTVLGIGLAGDATPINHWDLGVPDGSGLLAPTHSVIQQSAITYPYITDPTNSNAAPPVVSTHDVSVTFNVWRNNPNFVGAIMVSVHLVPDLGTDYHLSAPIGGGTLIGAPADDIDGDPRTDPVDPGADEYVGAP